MLDEAARECLLSHPVIVEEKLDGANMSIWIEDGRPHVGTRGGRDTIDRSGQRGRARAWAAEHADQLQSALEDRYAVYVEWLLRRHRLRYQHLPGPLVGIDVFDMATHGFLTVQQRDSVLSAAQIPTPPRVFEGIIGSVDHAAELVGRSAYADELAEGIVIRSAQPEDGCPRVAKLVSPAWRPLTDIDWHSDAGENLTIT